MTKKSASSEPDDSRPVETADDSSVPVDSQKLKKKLAQEIGKIIRAGYAVQTKVNMLLELLLPIWSRNQELEVENKRVNELLLSVASWGEEKAEGVDRDTQMTGLLWLGPFRNRAMIFFRAEKRVVSVVYAVIDLANFGKLNKIYGQHVGDIAISKVADILRTLYETHAAGAQTEERRETRKSYFDAACRAGGDEFHFLVTDVASLEDCRKMIRRIGKEIAEIEIPGIGHLGLFADIGAVYLEHDPRNMTQSDWLVLKASRTADHICQKVKVSARAKDPKVENHCGVRSFTTAQLLSYKAFKEESIES